MRGRCRRVGTERFYWAEKPTPTLQSSYVKDCHRSHCNSICPVEIWFAQPRLGLFRLRQTGVIHRVQKILRLAIVIRVK
jgi:hypothetical protein